MRVVCEVCGVVIPRAPSAIGGHVYCSKRCEAVGKVAIPFPWDSLGIPFSAYCDRADALLRAEIRARRGERSA